MKNPPVSHLFQRTNGFALVVTLSLMILLTVIAVGLLSLSTISLRSSSQEEAMKQARQNARLALMLAIGDLQSATGPDQRVTASADVQGATLAQPRITGVWQGWKWDGSGSADYKDKKQSQFLRWLVSTRQPTDATSMDFTKTAPTGATGTLVRGNRDPSEKDQVDAQIVPVTSGNKKLSQGIAWAVFDESTKLPTALPEPGAKSVTASMSRMAAAPLPGYASPTKRNWKPISLLANNRSKLVTAGQSSLIGIAPADRGFHDLTSRSAGIAADAGKGGLSVDLSRLFSSAAGLPNDYKNRFLYSDTTTPLVPVPARFSNKANPFPSPDPSWSLLYSHYRMFDKLNGGLNPTVNATNNPRPPAGTTGMAVQNHPFFQNQQLVPVIAKAQFVFSLSFAWHNILPSVAKPGNDTLPDSDPKKDLYATWLIVDPVITLWNPYNVNLRFTGGRIDLYRVPLTFRLYKNRTLINAEYTHLANCFLGDSSFGNRLGTYYRLNLLSETGTVTDPGEIIMEPGEHIVFTASNHVKNFNNEFSNVGLNLRPGFKPPAGNASDKYVGGVSTVNVCVSSAGANTGVDYGKSVRSIAVKPGDEMQIEVKPGRASVDKPAETGGKEISGFLKYYAGPPNKPSLVGGIELDYGNDEAKYLPSIPSADLPTFIVSKDIPKNQAGDVYQGTKPPPAVRFKEPFLISTFQLKTERDSKFPSKGWIDNSPVNLYASEGLDQTEPWSAQQYELQWEAMTDWPPSSPTIEISNTKNRGYGGPGIYAQTGLEFATHSAIPLAPALSLAQLRHAPLNTGGQLPLTSQIIGNSFAPSLLAASSIRSEAGNRTLLDHSFYANSTLFDKYFFSGLADPGGPLDQKVSVSNAITAFFDKGTPLPNNPRFVAHHGARSTTEIATSLTAPDGYLKTAAHLLIDSPFNVNSTRVDVWEAFLGSTFGSDVPQIQAGKLISATSDDSAAARQLPSNGSAVETSTGQLNLDLAKWNGHRRLTTAQIRRLSEEIVKEIQIRGPFQSLAEFINRRAETGPLGQSGALQTAIDHAEINKPTIDPTYNIVTTAGTGNAADGSPGVLNQADLLTPIAPVLTARGDTFRIRGYGEAGSPNGTKVRAWCEAVVQRVPEYLDATDEAWVSPTNPVNTRFGRHYEIISFRWLSSSEI